MSLIGEGIVRDDGTSDSGEGPEGTEPAPEKHSAGSIRWQDAATTRPRPPTLAEARQRDKAQKAREDAAAFAEYQERRQQARSASRRKVMMGSVAAIGLVGVVALGYHVLNDDDEVSATCVRDGTNEVVPEQYCSSGTSGGGGGLFIFAGSPYRYYYGGNNGGIGTTARGGTLELPKGTSGRTSGGQSITRGGGADSGSVTRGGFGSSSAGGSGS